MAARMTDHPPQVTTFTVHQNGLQEASEEAETEDKA